MNKPILIVDDEPHVRLSYRVGALAECDFTLVILDVRMPEMDPSG